MFRHFLKYIFVFLLFAQLSSAIAQDSPSYGDLITKADAYFDRHDFYNAKTSYQLALQLDANADYPKKRIEVIIQKLNDELELRIVFEEKIAAAEQAYAEKNYEKAIALYGEAAGIIDYEEQPKQEADRITKEWEDIKNRQSAFDQLLMEADAGKQNENYSLAIAKLEEANTLFPSKSEVLSEIAQLKLLLKQQNAKQNEFDRLLTLADKRMEQSRFQSALKNYLEAETLFPNDAIIKKQLAIVNDAIKVEEAYNAAVEKADAHYIALELDEAKTAYEEASKIWPEKTYPSNMLAKLDEAKQRKAYDLDRLNKEYEDKIASADKYFDNQKYESAYDVYIRALNLKPEEAYPEAQIQKINKLLATGYIDIKCEIHENGIALTGAFIEVIENGTSKEVAISSNGRHKLKLKLNKNYLLKFKKDGYIHKIFAIDSHLPNDEDLNTVFATDLSVELFPTCSIDLSFFDKPLAHIAYQESLREFNYDFIRVEAAIKRVEELKSECAQAIAEENKLKEYEAMLAEAETFKNAEEYFSAISSYQKAANIYPEKEYPKEQILVLNGMIKRDKEYNQLIASGDSKYAKGKLNDALFDYYKARNLKPKANYPREKIEEIDGILAIQNAEEKVYQRQLFIADSLFAAKVWEEAIAQFVKVIALKKEEAYPQNKLAEAKQLLAAKKELDAAYQAAIVEGDSYFEKQSFPEAKTAYFKANRLKSNEQYPLYKIEDINTIVEQGGIRKTNTRYRELLASADKLFSEKAYKVALAQYQQASNLKPNEVYPPQQIDKINQIIIAQNNLNAKYKRFIKSADSIFYLDELSSAREVYVLAKELKPQEVYPPAQINKIDALVSDRNDLDQNYQDAIARADANFSEEKYTRAKSDYTLALTYKSTEAYPKQKIKEIDGILAQMNAVDAAYQKAIKQGDQNFVLEHYLRALTYYEEALKIKQDEEYPKTRIARIESILAKLEQLNIAYNQAIEKADVFYKDKKYRDALSFYKEALDIKPKEKYPPDQILRINRFLESQFSLEEAYANALEKADKFFAEREYQSALSPYQKANRLKPSEQYPIDQLAKIRDLLGASEKEYQAFIKQGDDAYQRMIYQDAIMAYENALGIFPNEAYPKMMLDKIDAKIRRESVVNLVLSPEVVSSGIEKRYTFKPIDYRDRQDNYILIELKTITDSRMRVFINFGKDDMKNGGYAVNLVQRDGYTKYFVRIDRQLRWKSEDNNWISLLPEGGDLEVNKIQISREEKSN